MSQSCRKRWNNVGTTHTHVCTKDSLKAQKRGPGRTRKAQKENYWTCLASKKNINFHIRVESTNKGQHLYSGCAFLKRCMQLIHRAKSKLSKLNR